MDIKLKVKKELSFKDFFNDTKICFLYFLFVFLFKNM